MIRMGMVEQPLQSPTKGRVLEKMVARETKEAREAKVARVVRPSLFQKCPKRRNPRLRTSWRGQLLVHGHIYSNLIFPNNYA